MLWLGQKCRVSSRSSVRAEHWLEGIIVCSLQKLHGGESGERNHRSGEDELPRNEAVLPAKISECPLGCHRGEYGRHSRGLVRRDTNEEKEPIKLVKPGVLETMGIWDEQRAFASAVSTCIVSTCHIAYS